MRGIAVVQIPGVSWLVKKQTRYYDNKQDTYDGN